MVDKVFLVLEDYYSSVDSSYDYGSNIIAVCKSLESAKEFIHNKATSSLEDVKIEHNSDNLRTIYDENGKVSKALYQASGSDSYGDSIFYVEERELI